MSLTLCPSLNQCDYLIDTKERIALKEGVIEPLDFDEARPYRLLYGTFKSQPSLKRTRLEVMQYIESQLGRWLNHIEARAVHHLSIQGLVISESPVKRTDIQAPMHSEEVAFAALVKAPESFQINEQAHQVSVAYERHQGEGIAHVQTCLENREGVFVFTSEDTRFQPLTANNWLGYVDHFRILKEARRAQ